MSHGNAANSARASTMGAGKKPRRRLERYFVSIMQALPHGTYWKRPDGRYGGCSDAFARYVGIESPEDITGKRDHELPWSKDVSDAHSTLDDETLTTGRPVPDEEVIAFDSEGHRAVYLVTRVPLGDPSHGGIQGMLGLLVDITEVKELENQLGHSSRLEAIGQLAAGIAHEINTPTQYVSDNTRFLQDAFTDLLQLVGELRERVDAHLTGDGPVQQFAEEIDQVMKQADLEFLGEETPRAITESLEGLDRVAKIVRAMKDFSHPGEDKSPTEINHLIESTITVARNEWKYVAEVKTDLDPDLHAVPVLAGPLKQVVLNMIVNAAHAIESVVGDGGDGKGVITISSRLRGDSFEIEIRDTGCGVPEDIRARIFDPFFTTKKVGRGTGQGLNIAHAVVVNKHGGEIDVQSEVGKGTAFTMKIPIVSEDAEAEDESASSDREAAA